jgi:PhzF family phenazine biosynthesis protein
MRKSRRFAQLDVFADRPGAGNPLAVVLDADGIDGESMQAFAAWTNLSETTFLLPPTRPEASYRVRIFTPRQELPFAGHPSVGSAHAALESGLCEARDGHLVQECAAGLLPIRVEGEGAGRRIYVRAPIGRKLTLTPDQRAWSGVLDGLQLGAMPAVLIDNGPHWWIVELADEAAVRSLSPDVSAIERLTSNTDSVGVAFYAHADAPGYQMVVRAFCPASGIAEDPVTGSANAAIGSWLQQNDMLRARRYIASQGREIGRDGQVHVDVDNLRNVWIGGQTQTVVDGTLDW